MRLAIDTNIDPEPGFRVLERFSGDHPDIELDMREEVLVHGWEALIDDRVDLIIGAPEP